MNLKSHNYSFLLFLSVFCLVMAVSGCRLDDTSANPSTLHGFESFDALFAENSLVTQTKTADAGQDIVFTSENGANVKINANSLLTSTGNTVTGAVEIQLIETTKKSEWVMSNRPLVNTAGQLLEAATGISMSVWKDQEKLNLSEQATFLFEETGQVANTGETLNVYYDSNDNNGWEIATDQSSVNLKDITGGEVYEMIFTQLGWLASCRPYVHNNGTTAVSVTTNQSSTDIIDQKVYLLFDEFNGMAPLPLNGSTFSATGIPLNHSATLVAIAFDKFNFYFASEPVTITENLQLDINLRSFSKDAFILSIKNID